MVWVSTAYNQDFCQICDASFWSASLDKFLPKLIRTSENNVLLHHVEAVFRNLSTKQQNLVCFG